MANIKSSKKDLRRTLKRRTHNTSIKTALKTYVKRVKSSANETDAKSALVHAVSAIDKAAQSGIIHKNQAARRKSRVAKAANKLAASTS